MYRNTKWLLEVHNDRDKATDTSFHSNLMDLKVQQSKQTKGRGGGQSIPAPPAIWLLL